MVPSSQYTTHWGRREPNALPAYIRAGVTESLAGWGVRAQAWPRQGGQRKRMHDNSLESSPWPWSGRIVSPFTKHSSFT